MNYRETTEYLDSLNGLGSRPGLENISELLTRLGNPQNKVRAVHIAGTNGKGSVGAFLTWPVTASDDIVHLPYSIRLRQYRLTG